VWFDPASETVKLFESLDPPPEAGVLAFNERDDQDGHGDPDQVNELVDPDELPF